MGPTRKLTEKRYWERFWDNVALPAKVDLNFSNDFYISNILKKYLPPIKDAPALEVGCAPGKWMVFLSENFGYQVDGCEYLESASKKTAENLKLCGINNFSIYTRDFLQMDLGRRKYNVVIYLGFIEHFENPDLVISKQVDLLKNGGFLVIGIPKLTGLNHFIARHVDKYIDDKLIPNHNLTIMHKRYLDNLQINCKKIFVNTIGGFEPALFDLSKCPRWQKYVFLFINLIFNNRFFRKLNLGFYSGYLMGIYKKNG